MREFSFSVKEHMNAGLRPVKRNIREPEGAGSFRTKAGLVEAFNCRITKTGLEPYRPIVIPFTQETLNAATIQLNWPFPQLFRGKAVTILMDATRMWLVNEADWSLSIIDTFYKADGYPNFTTKGSIQRGNQWQFVDLWDAWMLHNGYTTILHSNRFNMGGLTDKILIASTPRVQAGCYHKGRVWLGGFDSDYFFTAGWTAFYEDWASRLDTGLSTTLQPFQENTVWWSSIGGGDAMFLFFSATDATTGYIKFSGYGSTAYLNFDYLKRNEAGNRVMPWQGKVRVMKPLGKYVIAYGDSGITALDASREIVGIIELPFDHGIANTGAVGGDLNEHIFLDGSGSLWHISSDLSVRELDYREYMVSMLGTEVIISFSVSEREWRICNGYRAFVFNKQGLCEHGQQVTSVINAEGNSLGMGTDESFMDKKFRLKTDTLGNMFIDVRETGLKTLAFIELFMDIPESAPSNPNVKVGVDFRYENRRGFQSSNRVPLNNLGQARVGVTAPDLRIAVEADDFRYVNIEDVICRFQFPDRRFVRGIGLERAR